VLSLTCGGVFFGRLAIGWGPLDAPASHDLHRHAAQHSQIDSKGDQVSYLVRAALVVTKSPGFTCARAEDEPSAMNTSVQSDAARHNLETLPGWRVLRMFEPLTKSSNSGLRDASIMPHLSSAFALQQTHFVWPTATGGSVRATLGWQICEQSKRRDVDAL
jgi:hypothetical protein